MIECPEETCFAPDIPCNFGEADYARCRRFLRGKPTPTNHDCFYFGCWGQPGHYLYNQSGRYVRACDRPPDLPWRDGDLDGKFLVGRSDVEGCAVWCQWKGWTLISFWDRTGDSRLGSNSAFIARGLLTFNGICEVTRLAYPQIWKRFTFEVRCNA